MSVNYHAAQSRGVLFENHEKVSEQWRQEFSQYDPARIKNTLHLETDEEYLYLQYFSSLYRLCLKNGVLEKKSDETWSDQLYFNEAMAIYHFLYYTKDVPVISESWVPSQTVDGVVSRRPTAIRFWILLPGNIPENWKNSERPANRQAARSWTLEMWAMNSRHFRRCTFA